MTLPYLCIQCDWDEALSENEGQAWISCKTTGQPGIHGDLQTVGLSSDGAPYVTASEGFQVISISKKKLTVCHRDPNCKTTFLAPKNCYKNVHLKSIVCLDVTHGGLGVSACTENKLLVWDTDKGLIRRELLGHIGDVYTCRFFPSGVVILSGGADMQLKIWSAETGQCPATLTGHSRAILDTAIVDKGRNVISVSRDGTAKLWDCGHQSCLSNLSDLGQPINGCALDSVLEEHSSESTSEREVGTGDKLLLLACEDKQFRGVAVSNRQQVFEFTCVDAVNSCSFITDVQVACGCQDGQVILLDLRNTSDALKSWLHSGAAVTSILPRKNGFICSKADGICMFYGTKTENYVQLTGPDCDPVYRVVASGNHIFTCCRDAGIRKYDCSSEMCNES